MADITDPSTIDSITNTKTVLDMINTVIANITTGSAALADNLLDVFGSQSKQNLTSFNNEGSKSLDIFTKLKSTLDYSDNKGFADLQDSIGKGADSAKKLIDQFTSLGAFVSKSKMFDDFSSSSSAAINTVGDNVNALQEGLKSLGIDTANSKIGALITNYAQNASQAEKLENNYIALAASTGQLNELFSDNGTVLKDLSSLTASYTKMIADSADATGMSVKQSVAFAGALGQVPGAMESVITGTGGAANEFNGLTTAMKLMSGSGRGMDDVVQSLTTAYEKLGNAQGEVQDSTQKGAQFFSTISEVANTLHLRFNDVRNVLDDVADQFKFVGDNTDGAARILGRYSEALKATGLTSKSSLDVIQGMVKSVGELSVAQKGFLSARSGGAGGLQGAFQIDQLLRQGKVDQVMQMTEKNLRQQLGGRIYSLQDASQSQQGASQFMRQRTLLQSGVFGIGKGTSDDQATRILEALKNRDAGTFKDVITGQDALQNVVSKGTDIQQRNFDVLKQINNATERGAIAAQISAGAAIKNAYGTGQGGKVGDHLIESMNSSAGKANEGTGIFANKQTSDVGKQLFDIGKDAATQFVAGSIGALQGTGNIVSSKLSEVFSKDEQSSLRDIRGTSNKNITPNQLNDNIDMGAHMQNIQAKTTTAVDHARRGQVLHNAIAASAPTNQPMANHIINNAANNQGGGLIKPATMQSQDIKLSIEVKAPEGFDVVATSNSSNAIIDNNRASINPARSMPARK